MDALNMIAKKWTKKDDWKICDYVESIKLPIAEISVD